MYEDDQYMIVPLPTYFIAGDEVYTAPIDALPNGGVLCPNFTYLGRRGIIELHGLKVGYLSGMYDQSSYFNEQSQERNTQYQPYYIEDDVLSFLDSSLPVHLDLLLTSEFGKNWNTTSTTEQKEAFARNGGSPVVAKLGQQISTR